MTETYAKLQPCASPENFVGGYVNPAKSNN